MNNEAQFAKKIVDILECGTQSMSAATADKLAAARKKAVEAMVQPVATAHLSPAAVGWHQLVDLAHGGGYRFWLPAILLLAALLAALSSTLTVHSTQPIDKDALLLASDLPPEAYADKEFNAWLDQSSQL